MAISYVGSTKTAVVNQLTFNFSLPTCWEDDIVVVIVGSSANVDDATIGPTTAGYTEEAELYANSSYDTNFSVSWKRMGATPDTSVDCEGTGGDSSIGTVAIAKVYRGVDTTTAMDVAVATATGTGSAIPNCSSITPVTEGAWVIACGCGTANDNSVTAPLGYSNHTSQEGSVAFPATAAICSKQWSGSGAEDPTAWTDWSNIYAETWAAVTLALRPFSIVELPSGSLTLTGSTPATAAAPASGSLTITGGTPVPATALSVSPASGSLTITGQTPVPVVAVAAEPGTGQLQFTGQTPQLIHNDLVIALPALTATFGGEGLNLALDVTLPELLFAGSLSEPSWMVVTLPYIEAEFLSGSSASIELPPLEIEFSAVVGAACELGIDLPELTFAATSGTAWAVDVPPLDILFSGTVGTAARLVVPLPAITSLFGADVQTLAQLTINLPSLQAAFTSEQEILSNLIVEFPALSSLFGFSAGVISSLEVNLPALTALLTSYEDITGQIVISLPVLKAYLELSHEGRFDTVTAEQLDATILKYRRPS